MEQSSLMEEVANILHAVLSTAESGFHRGGTPTDLKARLEAAMTDEGVAVPSYDTPAPEAPAQEDEAYAHDGADGGKPPDDELEK